MRKHLVVVESPAKAKTIGKFLGRGYQVKASMGHLRDLPKSKLGVDVDHGYEPTYINVRGKGPLIKDLKESAKKVDSVLFATDPDREGEAISWHLSKLLGVDATTNCRIEFNEITKAAIKEAVGKPRPIDQDRVDAQQARRVLDRLVGYKLSPLLWAKVRKGLSAGRVQSVALRLIVDREEEIQRFIPEEYWSIDALLSPQSEDGQGLETRTRAGTKAGQSVRRPFAARLVSKSGRKIQIPDKESADAILADLKAADYVVSSVKKREKRRNPPPPFTTSTLQQEASRKLRFSSRKTMSIAQQLYEGIELGEQGSVGLISYMRTDSTRIAEEAQREARSLIEGKYGEAYRPERPFQYKTREGAQDAHEAIRPTSSLRLPDEVKPYLSRDQYRLYNLIWQRFIASQMSSAVYDSVAVDVTAGEYLLRASGSKLKFQGFLLVYEEGRDNEGAEAHNEVREDSSQKDGEVSIDDVGTEIPELEEGQRLDLLKLDPQQHFTSPPPRYTEATLVKTLEENGVGRPSTYVSIIDTILRRNYVTLEDRQFHPTELGIGVLNLLKEHFAEIVDVQFTANLEEKLDQVAEGKLEWRGVIDSFYRPFEKDLERAMEGAEGVTIQDEVTDEPCPQCGRRLVIKHGRYGKFMACPGFPECKYVKSIVKELDVPCPSCGGKLVERTSRKGRKFFGCANYPECSFTSWNEPIAEKCPVCGAFMVVRETRSRGKEKACSNKQCGYTKPWDQEKEKDW